MKKIDLNSPAKWCLAAWLFLPLTVATVGFAQTATSNTIPVVTIQATDDHGTWTGVPAVFTVFRAGNPTPPLNVYCCISGSATNGVDYQTISSFVSLPAGIMSNTIVINPVNLGQTDTRTVTVDLCPSPLMMPVNYAIGLPSSATVYLTPPGVSNLSPVVRITSPPNGAVFRAPVNIPVFAYAADFDGSVTSVEFFAGGTSLGFGQHVTAVPPPLPPGSVQPPILIVRPTNYWELTWTNPPLGTDIGLTAKATDNGGASTVSDPVLISVLPSPPPPTNRPAIVSIIATDPIAMEGTNCWPWLGLASPVPTWSNWFAAGAAYRVFTNCGPKDATFTVFRFGATNDSLNVAYAIGGTATNGIDYVALPGLVSIPAGGRRADITVMPLDDGPPDITSTVILRLMPDATGTNYLLGLPRTAAAIILDSQTPRATTGMMPGAVFNFSAAGPDGAWFHVEYSTDMIHWTPICTNQVVNGSVDFVDPDAANNPARFYRTVPEAVPPP